MLYPAELQPLIDFPLQGRGVLLCKTPKSKIQRIFDNGAGGIRTPGTLSGHNSLAGSPIRPLSHRSKDHCSGVLRSKTPKSKIQGIFDNGAGGIRTPGTFRHNGFQDRLLQPLGHRSLWVFVTSLRDVRKHLNNSEFLGDRSSYRCAFLYCCLTVWRT